MNTEEVIVKLNDDLIAEGIPDAERQRRLTIFKICVEDGQKMSDDLNAKKAAMRKKQKKVPLSKVVEFGIISMAVGWFAGVLSLYYYQVSQ